VLNCDRSTVEHALQNTQNDCYQWLSNSSRVHQIQFWRLRPGPRQLDPLAGLRGLLLRGRDGKGGEGGEEVGERQGTGVGMPGKGEEEGGRKEK